MRFPPPEVVASWPRANYVNPETHGPALMITELTILPIALIVVALRLWVRISWLHKSWWDDWLMAIATFFSCGVTITVILASQLYGWDIHIWDLTLMQMEVGRKASIAGQTLFIFASGFTKMSILVSYLRIAPEGSTFRKLVWAMLGIVSLAVVAFLIVLWTQCFPTSSYWNLFADSRDCLPEGPPLMSQNVFTVVADIIIYILPMPTLVKLPLPTPQRIGLVALFGVGGIVVVAGIMRTVLTYQVVYQTFDITWYGFTLWIWTAVESNVGVICGCIPALRPLFLPTRSATSSRYGSSFGTKLSGKRQSTTLNDVELEAHGLTNKEPSIARGVTPKPQSQLSRLSIEKTRSDSPWEHQKVYTY